MRHLLAHTAGLSGLARADGAEPTSTTGRRPPLGSPRRRRGGSRARRPATTPSPRATSWARSSAGSAGRSRRHVLRRGDRRAARRRLPHRHRARARRTGSPRSSRRPSRSPTAGIDPDSILYRTFTNPPLDARMVVDRGVAPRRDPRRRRPRQRPLGGPRAVGAVPRRRDRRRPHPVAQAGCERGVRGADQRHRPRARRAAHASAWATASTPPSMPIAPEPAHLLLGRVGRLDRDQRPRRPAHRRLRDEPDGRGHHRRRPRHRRSRSPPSWRSWADAVGGLPGICSSSGTRGRPPSPRLRDAVLAGIADAGTALPVRVARPRPTPASTTSKAPAGAVLVTPENFGMVSGLVKDFLERIYPWFEEVPNRRPGLPYLLVPRARPTAPARCAT